MYTGTIFMEKIYSKVHTLKLCLNWCSLQSQESRARTALKSASWEDWSDGAKRRGKSEREFHEHSRVEIIAYNSGTKTSVIQKTDISNKFSIYIWTTPPERFVEWHATKAKSFINLDNRLTKI